MRCALTPLLMLIRACIPSVPPGPDREDPSFRLSSLHAECGGLAEEKAWSLALSVR